MTLIKQLQKGLIAIEAHGKYEDVERVLNVAFPDDNDNIEEYKHPFYCAATCNTTEWNFKTEKDNSPKGMKAVHIDEFIKELEGANIVSAIPSGASVTFPDGKTIKQGDIQALEAKYEAEKELRLKAEDDAKHWNKEHLSLCTKSIFKEEALNEDLKRMQDARNEAEEAGLIWKDSAEKLQTQIKELQPFERGSEGWCRSTCGIYMECTYWTNHPDDNFSIVYIKGKGWFARQDFTTENPHKKETVWESDIHSNNWDKWSKKGAIFIRRRNTIIVHSICTRDNTAYFRFTQIGDDLQAKFDDEENLKYIDLTKLK